MKTPTLGLVMITKNEEKYLSKCIDSVIDIVDEIVIVDSGSIDRTLSIAKKYNAKVYFKNWEDSFSIARNFAISKSKSDWLLLLDADEILEQDCKEKVLQLLGDNTYDGYYFKIHNYYGDSIDDGYMIHTAFRLLRNNNKYFYSGSIHEQITPYETTENSIFNITDAIIKHYGYLNENIKAKNKRGRNIPLLEKELLLSPTNPFYIYSLGNEFAALKENDKAIDLYEKARVLLTTNHSFAANLYYRLINALYSEKEYNTGIKRSNEAIVLFPEYVDFHYLNGLLHRKLYHYTIAMDSLNKCIQIGDTDFKFTEGCGTHLPYLVLGEIFEELKDYTRAINSYNNSVLLNRDNYSLIYRICNLLCKVYKDNSIIIKYVQSYFGDLNNYSNMTLFLDVLITNNITKDIDGYISKINILENKTTNEYYILGKYNFKLKHYAKALDYFRKILVISKTSKTVMCLDCNVLYITSLLLLEEDLLDFSKDILTLLKEDLSNEIIVSIAALSTNVLPNKPQTLSSSDYKFLLSIYNILLKEKELTIFYRYTPLLDLVSEKNKYLDIAKLLYNNGFTKDSLKYIKRSISTYDYIDKEASRILMLES